MENMNPFLVIGQLIMLLLALFVFLGILEKVGSIILAILAFPIYIGLFAFESTVPIVNKNKENIYWSAPILMETFYH